MNMRNTLCWSASSSTVEKEFSGNEAESYQIIIVPISECNGRVATCNISKW